MLKITCGVTHGSILGPIIFILYIKDLCNVSTFLKYALYPYDTNLFAFGNNIDTLCKPIKRELSKINIWFDINNLSLNLTKTINYIYDNRM